MIKEYKAGSDITLMNTLRFRVPKIDRQGTDDVLTIVYKDNKTGKKKKHEIIDPDYEYYIVKKGAPSYEYNRLFAPKEELEKITVPYRNLKRDIAKRTGNLEFYENNLRFNNYSANNQLLTHPNVFLSDLNLEDFYRMKFAKIYSNDIIPITKAFIDIETDVINIEKDFPDMGECPINAITIIFREEKQVFTYLLRDSNNPLQAEFEDKVIKGELYNDLRDFIIDNVGGIERATLFGVADLKYNFAFYDESDEIHLIYDLFKMINKIQPDFVLAWNMAFDIPFIIERCRVLGYDPAIIMSHPDFECKQARYYIDERAFNEYHKRGDYATITSYSIFLDQMLHFASRRVGQVAFPSFSLDYIGTNIAKVSKYDYKDITTDITLLSRKNYTMFVFYNIFDTIVQNCIEVITRDLEYVFSKCNENNTRYHKCHRQTVYLTNRGAKEFDKDGYIIGSNMNRGTEKPTVKFPGAFVADPSKINDYSKIKINGYPIQIYDNLPDGDFTSLYPHTILEYNIAPNTQIGILQIPEQVHNKENKLNDIKWSRGGAFMEDIQSAVWLEFASRWFGLGSYSEVYNDIIYYYTEIKIPEGFRKGFDNQGLNIAIEYYSPQAVPRDLSNYGEKVRNEENLIIYFKEMPNIEEYTKSTSNYESISQYYKK